MSLTNAAFPIFVLLSFVFNGVASWTFDLPEVRKFYFEKNANDQINKHNSIPTALDKDIYDNIESNSPHNSINNKQNTNYYDEQLKFYQESMNHNNKESQNDIIHGKYADEYDYQSYMEKQVHSVVQHGSVYLEGLRRAIERYSGLLKNCSDNGTAAQNEQIQPTSNSTNSKWLPENESPLPAGSPPVMDCTRATQASEHVRRLAELALWATRELQDRAVAGHYQGHEEEEQDELLLRLAWFLDRLAHLTGFQPDPKDFLTTEAPRVTSAPVTAPAAMRVPDDVKAAMMDCLRGNSSEPATERCKAALPPRQLYNISDTATDQPPPEPTSSAPRDKDSNTSLSEPMLTSETKLSKLPPTYKLSTHKPVKVQKRSIDDNPLLHVMKYYAKHKVWVNSNPLAATSDEKDFHVINDLAVKSVQKRAIPNKKSTNLRLPKDSLPNRTDNDIKHEQASGVKRFLKKVRDHSLTAKKFVRKSDKYLSKNVRKRSLYYEKKYLPSGSQDPQQDISYYLKNKPGVEYQSNVGQAALVRAGLEQVFQTGSLETVRRYGANYNPAIPDALVAGILKSQADF